MLPDPYIPSFYFLGLWLHPFGLLIGTGTVLAYFALEKRLPEWGLRRECAAGIVAACFVGGATGGHIFDVVAYQPQHLVAAGGQERNKLGADEP